MGTNLVSFKGDTWRGRTTLATNDRGDRRMVRITNGYVSSDGHEIRSFPGWRVLVDLSAENNAAGGYERYIIDAMRPVLEPVTPLDFYTTTYAGTDSSKQTLYTRAKPVYWQWFEQVGDVITIGGVTRFRENPIYDASRNKCSPVSLQTGGFGLGSSRIRITWDLAPASRSTTDAAGAGLNGLATGDTVYITGLTCADAADQAQLDALVNNRIHVISTLVSATETDLLSSVGSINGNVLLALTAGEIHVVRPNRYDWYPTPTGADPYDTNPLYRMDDLNALTTWRVIPTVPLSVTNAYDHTCYPAFVANRQRDFGDENDATIVEGILAGTNRGVSRREQKELPYRMVPESAGDRIIVAVPGYNCLFQVPLMVPINPENWPNTPTVENLGVLWFGNDQYDKPRSLGLPKCRLVDSPYTPAPSSPSATVAGELSTHLLKALSASPQFGFPTGTYRLVATYYDSVTGEEGEPSEPIEVHVPNNDGVAYAIVLTYMHPGYIMPECLADRINVYMTDVDGEAFGFYKSLELRAKTSDDDYLGYALGSTYSPFHMSSKYGVQAGGSPGEVAVAREWNTLQLPLPRTNGASIGDAIDFFRPPVQIGMPRGSSVARYIRGQLISGGHLGIEGPTGGLYSAVGSVIFNDGGVIYNDPSVLHIRQHDSNDFLFPADGAIDAGFGLASRNFPDALQGISALNKDLLPRNIEGAFDVAKVLNRLSDFDTTGTAWADYIAQERLETTRRVADPDFRISPSDPQSIVLVRYGRDFYWRMLKGQVQIGEPGLPWRVTKAGGLGIQVIDYNKDDDIVAIWPLAGNAIICSRTETHFLSWSSSALGQTPTLVSADYGCIAPNSMVEFDGGVAWISERGPVAIGAGLQFVGQDIADDFVGAFRRYRTDSRGMMRHTWSCHDKARGLVMWGMVIGSPSINDGRGGTDDFAGDTTDAIRSCSPCDEVLIWSYRTGSFSTWAPPSGLEVLWMRQMNVRDDARPGTGTQAVCWLASDGKIRMFDDTWNDDNEGALTTTAAAAGTSSTTLVTTATTWVVDGDAGIDTQFKVRAYQYVEAFNEDDELLWFARLSSADSATHTITLETAQTWTKNQKIRIGCRPAVSLETTAVGAEFLMTGDVKAVQMRYTLLGGTGGGFATAKVEVLKSDLETTTAPDTVLFGQEDGAWTNIGSTTSGDRHARRRSIHGSATAPEIAVRVSVFSEPSVRIADVSLELT